MHERGAPGQIPVVGRAWTLRRPMRAWKFDALWMGDALRFPSALWVNRDLWWRLTEREVLGRYRGSFLGWPGAS
jgi:hypothetical protein